MSRWIIIPAAAFAVMAFVACGDDTEPINADRGITADGGADGTSPWPDIGGVTPDSGYVQTDGSSTPKDSGGSTKDSYLPPAAKCNGTAKVYIEEVATGQPDYLALINKGSASVNLKGFTLAMMGISPVSYTFVAGASIAAGAKVYIFEYSDGKKAGDINTTKNIPFYDDLQSNAAALYDASGNLLDYVAIGDKVVGKPPGATAGLFAWPTSYDQKTQSIQRKAYAGACPTFKASDWTAKALTRTTTP
jgi:Lamin Tail Domain